MTIEINGSGTITGVSVGGLPDGIVDTDMLAADAVSAAKLQSTAIAAGDLPAGSILQVVQATTDTQSSTTSTSYVDVPGLSVSITPTSTASKILVHYRINVSTDSSSNVVVFQIVRGSTAIGNGSSGSRRACHSAWRGQHSDVHPHATTSGEYLDSPNTTSAITYKIQYNVDSATGYINQDKTNNNSSAYPVTLSSITLMEVAA